MQIPLNKLTTHLKNKLARIYLISGDVPLLIRDTRHSIQAAARQAGYERKELLQVESGFDWTKLISLTKNLGLFGDKSLIEILNPTAKFDDRATQILLDYIDSDNNDHVVVVVTNKLTTAQQKTRWYKAISNAGITIPVWPISSANMPTWIKNEFNKYKLTANTESIQLLAELTEGNLLATQQAIEKIHLLFPQQRITRQEVLTAISDNARFNIFDLSYYLLQSDMKRAIRIFTGLRQEGTEPTLILWLITKEIRQLILMKEKIKQGIPMAQVLQKEWYSRKASVQQALTRLSLSQLNELLPLASQIDRMIKGMAQGNPWDYLLELILQFSGKKLRKYNVSF